MTFPEITLRYFEARGRAQALREFLTDLDVQFTDEVIPLQGTPDWLSVRERPELAGPFKALPVLHWGDAQLVESIPIASFLTRHLPPSGGLDELALCRLDAVCSAAAGDVFMPVAQVIWSSTAFPGCEPETAVRIHGPRALAKLACIDALYHGVQFLGGDRPALADFYVADGLYALGYILAKPERLQDRLPEVSALAQRLSQRASARRTQPVRPQRLTGCPIEAQVVERLRAVDWLP